MVVGELSEISARVRVIGIDPGLADTGYGVVDWLPIQQRLCHVTHGVICTGSAAPIQARIHKIIQGFNEVWNTYVYPVRLSADIQVCAESYQNYGPVHWNGVQTLYTIGALIAHGCCWGYNVELLGARQAKLVLGCKGRLDTHGKKIDAKEQVRTLVTKALGLPKKPTPLHASDALGIALARLVQLERTVDVESSAARTYAGVQRALRESQWEKPCNTQEKSSHSGLENAENGAAPRKAARGVEKVGKISRARTARCAAPTIET